MRMKTSRVRVDQKMRSPFECISWCSPSGTWEKSARSIAAVNRITRERTANWATKGEILTTDYADLFDQFPDLAPGDEFDVVFLQDFTKGVAGEEFEVALAP